MWGLLVTVLKEESQILKVWDLIYNLPRRFQILVGAMDEDKALHSWNPGMFKPNFGISRPFLVLTSPKLFLDTDNRVSLRFKFQAAQYGNNGCRLSSSKIYTKIIW